MLNYGSNIVVHACFSSGDMLSFSSEFNWKLWLMSWLRLASVRPRCVLSFGVWTQPRRMTLTMKERSGTTRSLRTRNRRSLTPPPFDFWFPLEQSPRGGPAGEGMWVMVAGTSGAAAAPGWRCLGKAFVAVQEMRVRGMLHIPQRHYICTDGCSRANLRRRGGLPPAEPQVRQKDKYTLFLFLLSIRCCFFSSFSRPLTFLGVDAWGPIIVWCLFCLSATWPLQISAGVHTLSTNYSVCRKCSSSNHRHIFSCK